MIRAVAILPIAILAAAVSGPGAWAAQDQAPGGSPSGLRAPPGALSCAGCHGARPLEGRIVPPIAGRPADETMAALAAFRSGERPATVMDRIAKGFDAAETRAIAIWLERQAR